MADRILVRAGEHKTVIRLCKLGYIAVGRSVQYGSDWYQVAVACVQCSVSLTRRTHLLTFSSLIAIRDSQARTTESYTGT